MMSAAVIRIILLVSIAMCTEVNQSKHPKQLSPTETIADKDHILDENDNQKLLSMLNLDSDNDQENIPNLQVVSNSSVFVRGALRNIFEKLLTNPQTLLDTPVADLEKPDIRTRIKFSKTSKTLEASAELQASNDMQNALAELQASKIVQQAITELRSSIAVQNALQELQKSPAIQQVITELQSSNAIKKRLEEGLSSIQMVMTEASERVQKAIAEDPEVLQKALAGLQITNVVQDAMEGLRAFSGAMEGLWAFSGALETKDKMQTSNEVQEAMEELMALNAMEGAIVKAQDAAEATVELQYSSILKETREDADADIDNGQETMPKIKATDSVETVTSKKSDAEEPNDMENEIYL